MRLVYIIRNADSIIMVDAGTPALATAGHTRPCLRLAMLHEACARQLTLPSPSLGCCFESGAAPCWSTAGAWASSVLTTSTASTEAARSTCHAESRWADLTAGHAPVPACLQCARPLRISVKSSNAAREEWAATFVEAERAVMCIPALLSAITPVRNTSGMTSAWGEPPAGDAFGPAERHHS